MRYLSRIALTVLGICCLVLPAAAPGRAPSARAGAPAAGTELAAQIDAYLAPLVSADQFSGSVLVARAGKVIFARGYGMANRASNLPNRTTTRFGLASLTKAFTATAVLQLQQQGKLRVTDHICAYFTGCTTIWQPITIQQLLTHSSGLPEDDFVPDSANTPEKYFAYMMQQPLKFQPGTKWEYNDFAYRMLAYIVQKVSGKPFTQVVRDGILRPLHMRASGFVSPGFAQAPDHAVGYDGPTELPQNFPSFPRSFQWFYGAGGLYSNVLDLERWDQALNAPGILSRQSLHAMFKPWVKTGVPVDGPLHSAYYGYGWFIDRFLDRPVVQHSGGARTGWAYLVRFPRDRISVIVLCNQVRADRDVTTFHLARLVLTTS